MKRFMCLLLLLSLVPNAFGKADIKFHSFYSDTPREYVYLVFQRGSGSVPVKKQGVTSILKEILSKGPIGVDEQTFKKNLFLENVDVSFKINSRNMVVEIMSTVGNLENSIKTVFDVIKRPKFNKTTFKSSKNKVLDQRIAFNEDMRKVVYDFGLKHALGFHPSVLDGIGTPASIKKIHLTDIKHYYQKITGNGFSVYATGKTDSSSLRKIIKKHLPSNLTLKQKSNTFLKPDIKALAQVNRVEFIQKNGATDNQILYTFPIQIKFGSKEFLIADIAFNGLGGKGGKLFEVLRGQRGLTYHAGSYLREIGSDFGVWFIWTFGGIKEVSGLLKGVPEVVGRFSDKGITQEKLIEIKDSLISDYRTKMELPKDRLIQMIRLDSLGIDTSFMANYEKILKSIELSEVNKFINNKIKLSESNSHIYVMGDYSKLSTAIKNLKLPVRQNSFLE